VLVRGLPTAFGVPISPLTLISLISKPRTSSSQGNLTLLENVEPPRGSTSELTELEGILSSSKPLYIAFSLDGPLSVHEVTRGYGIFSRVVESIRVLADLGFNVSVNTLCQLGYTPDNKR